MIPQRYLRCHPCDKEHLSRESLMQHIRTRHMDLAPFNCDQCQLSYVNKKRWEQHVYAHHNDEIQHQPAPAQAAQVSVDADGNRYILSGDTKYVLKSESEGINSSTSGGRVQFVTSDEAGNEQAVYATAADDSGGEPIHTFRFEGDKLIQISGPVAGQPEFDANSAGVPSGGKKMRYELGGAQISLVKADPGATSARVGSGGTVHYEVASSNDASAVSAVAAAGTQFITINSEDGTVVQQQDGQIMALNLTQDGHQVSEGSTVSKLFDLCLTFRPSKSWWTSRPSRSRRRRCST